MKKPFSVRIEETSQKRFKALSAVTALDGSELLNKMIIDAEKNLTEDQLAAYTSLMKAWKDS